MTASQMADGSHTLRIRLVDEVNCQLVFYPFLCHLNEVPFQERAITRFVSGADILLRQNADEEEDEEG
jgi:hypothetical protein